eukprot:CAMPEP_0202707640 /NCGR_PEP_ID=MMETSP1385-20130828/19940_1 /ASSEMBLY_ACC=CAM_ASM_000861 /TAXON_ID=933848 /ORGANISM="Elphidium margaritaceum" /LENGTH=393 /DNA_ID=CAMNT_0049366391 /DNA_START=677 /DNA_END=1858 /DNA_ORIENTATION=+
MEIKLLYLRLLCGVSVTLLIAAFIYFLFDVNRQFEAADNDCSKTADFNLVRPLLPAVIVDTVTSMLLLYLFIHKLSVLIRAQTSSVESFAHASQSTLQRIRALVLVSTKLTVLVCVYIVAYWLLYVLFFPVLPGAAVMMELCIGCVITVWCYEFHVHHYNKYCFPCKWCCFHICFWWFIFCKEDSDARHRFNVCEICCALESKATRKNQQSLSERKRTSNTKHEVMLSTVIQSDAEYKHEVDTQQSAQNTQSTKVSDKISAVSNAIVNHEKTGTFVIHLQDELKASDDNVHDNDDDDDEEENQQIDRSKTNTFDYRAQRLRELNTLFFDVDMFQTKNRKRKKENAAKKKPNQSRLEKRSKTDFDMREVHDADDDETQQAGNEDHVISKSKTTM